MRILIKPFIFVLSAWMATLTAPAFAGIIWAQASGNWESTATWAGGVAPGSADNAYIGSSQAPGVNNATVTLQAAESASGVYVGYGSPSNGVLNLNGHTLTITNALTIGDLGGTGTVNENGGSFSAGGLDMYTGGSSFTFGSADAVANIDIENGAALSTVATGNITTGGNIVAGGVVNLGANTSMSGGLNVEGSGSTLNLAGNNLSIATLWLGFFQSSAVNLNRGSPTAGTLTVSNLDLGNSQNLSLIAGDAITNVDIQAGATLTTAATSNITGGVLVNGATLNLGANLNNGTNTVNVQGSGATLNLAGNNLSTKLFELGFGGSSAVTFQRGSPTAGTLTVSTLEMGNGQNLSLIAGDTITSVDIQGGSTLTTAATSNITGGVLVNGATLNLGANLNNGTNTVNVENSGATLNLAGNNLSTNLFQLGFNGSSAVTFNRGSPTAGTLTVSTLDLGNGQNLSLIAGDTVSGTGGSVNIVGGATLTTAATGNITNGVLINGGTLILGASFNNTTSVVTVENSGSTLNLAGHNLTTDTLNLGYNGTSAVTFSRGSPAGTLSLNSLNLGNGQSVTLVSGDRITGGGVNGVGDTEAINIYTGATLTSVSSQNITCFVNIVGAGSTFNLGASTNLGNEGITAWTGGTLNLNGHSLTVAGLFLANGGTGTVTFNRGSGGTFNTGDLFLGNGQNLTLVTGDRVNFAGDSANVETGATLSTVSSQNITSAVNVETGGTFKLGANLNLGGNLNIQDTGSIFNAQNHAVTAADLMFASNGSAAVTVSNLGTVTATQLLVGNGTSLTMHGGDTIGSIIDLENSSVLNVQQSSTGFGLTLNGTLLSDLTIDPSSMNLIFTSTAAGNWDFRWQDPNGANWVSTLTTMISDGQINLTLPAGQTAEVLDAGGYTYIVGVPEPSSLVLMSLALAGLGAARRSKRTR